MKTESSYFGVKRGLSVAKMKGQGDQNCLKVTVSVDGKKVDYSVCAVGNKSSGAQLYISRGIYTGLYARGGRGKQGGVKRQAGLSACSAKGQQSKCVVGQAVVLRPGGGGSYRRKGITVLNGMRRRR